MGTKTIKGLFIRTCSTYVGGSIMSHPTDMMRNGYHWYASYSVESPCMGGEGSKLAFRLLKDYEGILIKRSYTIYKGHTSFELWAKTSLLMKAALNRLHEGYSWIDDSDHMTNCRDLEKTWNL